MGNLRAAAVAAFVGAGFAAFLPEAVGAYRASHDVSWHELGYALPADGSWVRGDGTIDPSTLFRSGNLVAFRMRERNDGVVYVVRNEGALSDEKLWRPGGLKGLLLDAKKKADHTPDEPGELSSTTRAYLEAGHSFDGMVVDPDGMMRDGTIEMGGDKMKLTGMFGSYASATSCPRPVRAILVGELPPSRGSTFLKALVLVIGALVSFAVAAMLGLRRTVPEPAPVPAAAPRGPQLAGEECAACDQTIVTDSQGAICPSCARPVHASCLARHVTTHGPTVPYRA